MKKVTDYRLQVAVGGFTPYHFFSTKSGKGFSTLEMLIAMTILVMSLGAVVLVSFSNQSILVDSELSSSALAKAQETLESVQTLARKDFKLVNSIPEFTDPLDPMFKKKVDVEALSDSFSKKIITTVSWMGEHLRTQSTVLTSIVSDFENPSGADTCSSVLSGNWTNSTQKFSVDNIGTLSGVPAGTYTISDVDAYLGNLYLAISNGTDDNPTFVTLNISDPTNPTAVSVKSIDNDATSAVVDRSPIGLAALAVTGAPSARYVFAANAHSANFNTASPDVPCDNPSGANQSCGQLQVIDLGTSLGVAAQVVYTLEMPTVVGQANAGVGKSIFYKDGFIYLGRTKTDSGPEFNVIDVHNPAHPLWLGGLNIGVGINAIAVRTTPDGTFAYIATPGNTLNGAGNGDEVSVINVSNPTSPTYVGGFVGANDQGHGKSIYFVGDTLYLGDTSPGAEELYKLDNSAPFSFTARNPYTITNPSLFKKEIGSSVNGLMIRDYLAFLVTTSGEFQTWNISNPASVTLYDASPLTLSGSAQALDCEGNFMYVATGQAGGSLYTIAP